MAFKNVTPGKLFVSVGSQCHFISVAINVCAIKSNILQLQQQPKDRYKRSRSQKINNYNSFHDVGRQSHQFKMKVPRVNNPNHLIGLTISLSKTREPNISVSTSPSLTKVGKLFKAVNDTLDDYKTSCVVVGGPSRLTLLSMKRYQGRH